MRALSMKNSVCVWLNDILTAITFVLSVLLHARSSAASPPACILNRVLRDKLPRVLAHILDKLASSDVSATPWVYASTQSHNEA